MRSKARGWQTPTLALSWAVLCALWLAAATGHAAPVPLSRSLAAACLLLTAVAGIRVARRRCREAGGRVMLALLVLALVVRFVGLDFELADHYYGDEGIYTHHSSNINGGKLLVQNFTYPHLIFYIDAFLNWLATLVAAPLLALAERFLDIGDWPLMSRFLNRAVAAALGAATVVPAFAIASRFGGTVAGGLAALLVIASRLLNGGSHLAINDGPAAFFAAVALVYVVRLLDAESRPNYALAGVWAGLAAGAKYPAGLVAVAIAAVWLLWRWRTRRFGAGVLVSAAAALAVFLISSPGLVFLAGQAFGGGESVFRGLEIYGGKGWAGVTPPSNALYYLGILLADFGWPAWLCAGAGLALLAGSERRALAWLTVFPVGYLALVSSFTIAVPRTLYPIVPPLAALLAVPAAALLEPLAARFSRPRAATALAALTLTALPLFGVICQSIAFTRHGTRGAARDWIRSHLPRGAILYKEEYTPSFAPDEYAVRLPPARFLGELEPGELERPEIDLLVVSGDSWSRFFRDERSAGVKEAKARDRYQRIFDNYPLLAEFVPGRFRMGPEIRLYAIARPEVEYLSRATYSLDYAFVPDPARVVAERRRILFSQPGDWCQLKGFFSAGDYSLEIVGEVSPESSVTVRDFSNREIWHGLATGAVVSPVTLPEDGKYFFFFELSSGSELHAVHFVRQGG